MQPWKMFIRSVSIVTLLTAGGFAAGQAVVPFANASRGVSPAVEEPAPDDEAPVVDPAAEAPETDDSTTTTTKPEAPATDDAPSTDDTPSADPVVDPAPAPEVPETTTTTVTPVDVTAVPPAAPVADPAPKAKKDKKAKKDRTWDHDCNGKADNGWRKKDRAWFDAKGRVPCILTPDGPVPAWSATAPAPAAPVAAPAAAPASASDNQGRSDEPKQDGNRGRSDGAKQDGDNGRSASAPGRMKKGL